jgi:hypothetical protein
VKSRSIAGLAPVVILTLALAGCAPPDQMLVEDNGRRLTEPVTFGNISDPDFLPEILAGMEEMGIVVSDETRTDAFGTWNPLTLTEDSSVYEVDPEVLGELTTWAGFDIERDIWPEFARYLVTEAIDSELVWDDTSANRQAVAARVEASDLRWPDYLTDFINRPGVADYDALPWGRMMTIDVNYNDWRGRGRFVRVQVDENDSERTTVRNSYAATQILATAPAPYVLGEPRTLVESVELADVELVDSEGHAGQLSLEVGVYYYRPIVVDAVRGPVFENDILYFRVLLATDASGWYVQQWLSYGGLRTDVSIMSRDSIGRLPLLPEAAEASAADGATVELRSIRVMLPASATEGRTYHCIGTLLQPGDDEIVRAYNIEQVGTIRGCLVLWSELPDPDEEQDPWITLYPNGSMWAVESEGLSGNAQVYAHDQWDLIWIELTDRDGAEYRFDALVPPGAGQEFASQMVAGLEYVDPTPPTRTLPTAEPSPAPEPTAEPT